MGAVSHRVVSCSNNQDSQSDGHKYAIPWKATSSSGAPSVHDSDGGELASSPHTAASHAICHTGLPCARIPVELQILSAV